MQRAVKVKPMNQYLLLIEFDNKEVKVFNCLSLMQNKLFSRLADVSFFKTVHIDNMGLVCWDDSTDINPYDLYNDSETVSDFTFAN